MCPSLRSLWPTVFELFAETFHAPLYSFVWRRHIGGQFWCTNMAAGNQQKHLEYTFSIKRLLFTRELAYVHKNTSTLEMVKLPKIKRNDFFQRDSIPILVSHALCVITRKLKLLYFRNEICFGAGNFYKDLFLFIFNLV